MKEYKMSRVSDQRGWEDRDLTGRKRGKPEKGDDFGNKQVSEQS